MTTSVAGDPVDTDRLRTKAKRLVAASLNRSYQPLLDVDWDAELPADLYFMTPERVSLYGTALWDEMIETQRIELSKHELAKDWSVGVWFEMLLCQMLIRWAYDLDPRDPRAQYVMTELGDETRHIQMFATAVERLGVPWYGLTPFASLFGRVYKMFGSGISMLAPTLIGEELPDRFQRELMNDERLQPLSRMVCRIHVVEEARHVSFARDELCAALAEASPTGRVLGKLSTAFVGLVLMMQLGVPRTDVYREVGLNPRRARQEVQRNPLDKTNRLFFGEKLVTNMRELGMYTWYTTPIWKLAGIGV